MAWLRCNSNVFSRIFVRAHYVWRLVSHVLLSHVLLSHVRLFVNQLQKDLP